MRLLTWDTVRDTLEYVDVPPYLQKAVRWVERHPRTFLVGALVVVMAVMLARTPAEPVEQDSYSDETPLFI